jgi:L-asparagine oxygenase
MDTLTDLWSVTMRDGERDTLSALADQLSMTGTGRVDDPAWVTAGRGLSCRLPSRLREALRQYQHDPGDDGVLLIRELPLAPHALAPHALAPHALAPHALAPRALAPTPSVPCSVEREATTAAAVIALISLQLGELIAYQNEKAGALIQNVVPVKGEEKVQSNAGSTALELHIENAFHPCRPDFVVLLCLRCDHDGRAGLLVAPGRRAVRLLPDDAARVLYEPRFVTVPPPSFGTAEDAKTFHPLLEGAPDDPAVRLDLHATYPMDDDAAAGMACLRDALSSVAGTVYLKPGDLVVLDNRITLHGRTPFTPRYDGQDRWLHRAFVQLDYRRSRAERPANSHVLR